MSNIKIKKIPLPDCQISYIPKLIDLVNSKRYYQELLKLPDWEIKDIKIAGRVCQQNRYTCFYSTDPTLQFRYSGTLNTGKQMPPILLEIKDIVEKTLDNKFEFNFCLLNYYKDGSQNIGLHSDDITDLNPPTIASLSLGEERKFQFKHKLTPKHLNYELTLLNGSLVVMEGEDTQKNYKHTVPIEKNKTNGRINLTFRCVKKI